METGNLDVLALQARAAAEAQRVIDAVRPEQLTAPTPCTRWDVRALLNHMIGGNLWAAATIAGAPLPDRSADFVGDDPKTAFASTAQAASDALAEPGVLERTYQLPFGEAPGGVLAAMRFADTLIHTWDLAKATGQSTALDPELCEIALTMSRRRLSDMPRDPDGPFGPEVPVPADAPVCDRLAGFLGRQP